MSTRQEARDERESGAARKAADELAPSQRGHEREGAREKHHPGVLGSIKEGTKSLLGAITGRTQEAAEKTSEKAGQTKDAAVEKAKEYKEKLGEYKETGTEKAREGTETAKQKMEEYKDAAADAARKAGDYLAGTGEATKGKVTVAEERARQKLEEAERAREREEERRSTEVHRDDDTEKGRDDKGGILGAVGSVAERVKEKLTASKDEGDKAADEPKRGPESVDPHGKM